MRPEYKRVLLRQSIGVLYPNKQQLVQKIEPLHKTIGLPGGFLELLCILENIYSTGDTGETTFRYFPSCPL